MTQDTEAALEAQIQTEQDPVVRQVLEATLAHFRAQQERGDVAEMPPPGGRVSER